MDVSARATGPEGEETAMNRQLSAVRFKQNVSVCKVAGLPIPMDRLNTNLFSVTEAKGVPGRCDRIEVTDDGWVFLHGTRTGWPIPLACRVETIQWSLPAPSAEAPKKGGKSSGKAAA